VEKKVVGIMEKRPQAATHVKEGGVGGSPKKETADTIAERAGVEGRWGKAGSTNAVERGVAGEKRSSRCCRKEAEAGRLFEKKERYLGRAPAVPRWSVEEGCRTAIGGKEGEAFGPRRKSLGDEARLC